MVLDNSFLQLSFCLLFFWWHFSKAISCIEMFCVTEKIIKSECYWFLVTMFAIFRIWGFWSWNITSIIILLWLFRNMRSVVPGSNCFVIDHFEFALPLKFMKHDLIYHTVIQVDVFLNMSHLLLWFLLKFSMRQRQYPSISSFILHLSFLNVSIFRERRIFKIFLSNFIVLI